MSELPLERRLRNAARELDAEAPTFDAGRLATTSARRPSRRGLVLICALALAAAAAAAPAISAFHDLFAVDEVPTLAQPEPGVAPPFAGREVPVASAAASAPFALRMIPSLGAPTEARVRDDVEGGMVTLFYHGVSLTQWRTSDVTPRVAIVPAEGIADSVSVGRDVGLWIEGEARGTFTLVGADGAVHRETFDTGDGALVWRDEEMTFLLRGAASKRAALSLAREV